MLRHTVDVDSIVFFRFRRGREKNLSAFVEIIKKKNAFPTAQRRRGARRDTHAQQCAHTTRTYDCLY